MRSLGRKNLVLITQPNEPQNKLTQSEQLGKPYKKMTMNRAQTLFDVDIVQQSMVFNRVKHARYSTTSITNQVKAKQKLKNVDVSILESNCDKEQIFPSKNKSKSKSRKKLIFTPRAADIKNSQKSFSNKQLSMGVQYKIKNLAIQIKKIILGLKEIFKQISLSIKQFFNKILQSSKQFQTVKNDICDKIQINQSKYSDSITSSMLDTSYRIQSQAFKIERIFAKYEKIHNQFEEIPALDLSCITKKMNLQPTAQKTAKPKNSANREIKTERHVSKKFQFDSSSRTNRKFSTFNQTLNRIKRLSFEGSILKV